MFKKQHHQGRKSANPLVIFFRMILSFTMFIVLLGGVYSAYKHFSGLDPLKLDPQAILQNTLAARTPKQFTDVLSSFPLDKIKLGSTQKILGKEVGTKQAPLENSIKPTSANLIFKFLLISDSHNSSANLVKAIDQGKQIYPDLKFIIGLGDYTDIGTTEELMSTKKQFDSASLRYFLVPGDHDLWDCRNRSEPPASCFTQVFGPNYQSFEFDNFLFLLLDNSDNYVGVDSKQTEWIANELEKARNDKVKGIFVFLHEPLFHPSSDHVMGWVEKILKSQAGGLIFQLKDAGTSEIFAGHIHYFSQYSEPKTNMPMITIGALATESNPQAPRFAVVSVLDDGSVKVEDVEIK